MARLDRVLLEMDEVVTEEIHQLNLVREGDCNMETTWVEGNCITLLSLVRENLKTLVGDVPNSD